MTRPRLRPTELLMHADERRVVGRCRGLLARPPRPGPARPAAVPQAIGVCLLAHAAAPSMTRSSTWCSSMLGGRAFVHDAALADDEDAVGEPEHLGHLAGHEDDGDALVGEAPDEGVDLAARADVDAAGRLVEQQHAGSRASSQRARTTFCWLPPESVRTERCGVRPGGRRGDSPCSLGAAALSSPRSQRSPSARSGAGVASETLRATDSSSSRRLALALLRGEADARRDGGAAPTRCAARLPSTVTVPPAARRAP